MIFVKINKLIYKQYKICIIISIQKKQMVNTKSSLNSNYKINKKKIYLFRKSNNNLLFKIKVIAVQLTIKIKYNFINSTRTSIIYIKLILVIIITKNYNKIIYIIKLRLNV